MTTNVGNCIQCGKPSKVIERQAAIDVAKNLIIQMDEYHQYNQAINNYCAELVQLPSAQPERSSEIQDILEYLDTVLHPIISPDHWNVYSELHDMISMLPSAQPEPCQDAISRQAALDAAREDGKKMTNCNIFCLYGWYCEHFDEFAEGVYTACKSCEYFSEEEDE